MSDYGPPPPPGPPYGQQPYPPQAYPPQPYGYPGAPQARPYATWVDRVVATLWDVLYLWPAYLLIFIGVIVFAVGVGIASAQNGGALGVLLASVGGLLMFGGWIWAFVRYVMNYMVEQGRTGYTWGKRKVGIRLVDERTGQPPGIGSCVGRYFLHGLINYVFLLDYLWPLWDPKTQTLTDKVLTTVEIKQPAL